jgi:hypothetical protein
MANREASTHRAEFNISFTYWVTHSLVKPASTHDVYEPIVRFHATN